MIFINFTIFLGYLLPFYIIYPKMIAIAYTLTWFYVTCAILGSLMPTVNETMRKSYADSIRKNGIKRHIIEQGGFAIHIIVAAHFLAFESATITAIFLLVASFLDLSVYINAKKEVN